MACRKRHPISHNAPLAPENGSIDRSTEANVKTANPAL